MQPSREDELAVLQARLRHRDAQCRQLTEDLDFAEAAVRVFRRRCEALFVENERLRMRIAALEEG